MFVLSVPIRIRTGESGEMQTIGVLAMSIKIADWKPLTQASEGKSLVLADLREYPVVGEAKTLRGVILHHRRLAELPQDADLQTLDEAVVTRLESLRKKHDADGQIFDDAYRDRLEGDSPDNRWLAAAHPVVIPGWADRMMATKPDQSLGDTGWIVIVQERNAEQ